VGSVGWGGAGAGAEGLRSESDRVGMKMERKLMELSGAIFVFIFLCGSRNEYKNIKNKYENEYF
jgi:hypothetical protein